MGLAIRFYLFGEDGLQAISQRVMLGLIRGRDAMPRFAGTKQRIADVIFENDGRKPVRIARIGRCQMLCELEWGEAAGAKLR